MQHFLQNYFILLLNINNITFISVNNRCFVVLLFPHEVCLIILMYVTVNKISRVIRVKQFVKYRKSLMYTVKAVINARSRRMGQQNIKELFTF